MWLGSEARVVACPLPERDNVNTMAAMKRVEGAIIYILLKWLCIMVIFVLIWKTTNGEHSQIVKKDPTVVIALLIRNKAHTLPYFLTLLERLDYAKDRISLW
jgi:sensor histidine kinase YesM